jgi:hypothetical protein
MTDDPVIGDYENDVGQIEVIQTGLSDFWKDAYGWAPVEAAAMLENARLDWLPSLASTLRHWSTDKDLSAGELILAWANLGSLLEGSLKLFLSVHLGDYEKDADMVVALGIKTKKGDAKTPDELMLDQILKFCRKRKILTPGELEFIELLRDRRNTIHAFKNKELGTTAEFRESVTTYLIFLAGLAMQMPYPEEYGFHWLDLAGRIRVSAKL